MNGSLRYFVRATRWDIAHSVSRVSQFNQSPAEGMVASLKRIAGYLKSTIGFRVAGLVEPSNIYTRVVSSYLVLEKQGSVHLLLEASKEADQWNLTVVGDLRVLS